MVFQQWRLAKKHVNNLKTIHFWGATNFHAQLYILYLYHFYYEHYLPHKREQWLKQDVLCCGNHCGLKNILIKCLDGTLRKLGHNKRVLTFVITQTGSSNRHALPFAGSNCASEIVDVGLFRSKVQHSCEAMTFEPKGRGHLGDVTFSWVITAWQFSIQHRIQNMIFLYETILKIIKWYV